MLQDNVDRIMEIVSGRDVVVDIGGWAQPFNRATHVVDIMPYATRGVFGSIGGEKEFFREETWYVHDVCSTRRLPFADKSVDFVVCSHVLEDIRDPLHLCAEMIRIGKRGYIEVPSRLVESIRGLEGRRYAGYYHHRWLIECTGNRLTFRHKPHSLHNSRKHYLPNLLLRRMKDEDRVTWLFWEQDFDYVEVIQLSSRKVEEDLELFAKRQHVPHWMYWIDPLYLWAKYTVKDIVTRADAREAAFWSRLHDIESR